jgi:hypothetical protein
MYRLTKEGELYQIYEVLIDLDGVVCDYEAAHAAALLENPQQPYPQSVLNFYINLKPIKGAVEMISSMIKGIPNINVTFVSAPSLFNPLSYTEKRLWIENHFGFENVHRLILAYDKSQVKGDVLIDDHISGRGQEKFDGWLIHFGGDNCKSWAEVPDLLSKLSFIPADKRTELGHVIK